MRAAAVSDLIEGEGFESEAEVEDGPVALFLVGGTIYALGPCTHEGGPLSQGAIRGFTVVCPWHSARFDLQTGACLEGPSACRVDGSVGEEDGGETPPVDACEVLDVKVLDGQVFVRRRAGP